MPRRNVSRLCTINAATVRCWKKTIGPVTLWCVLVKQGQSIVQMLREHVEFSIRGSTNSFTITTDRRSRHKYAVTKINLLLCSHRATHRYSIQTKRKSGMPRTKLLWAFFSGVGMILTTA